MAADIDIINSALSKLGEQNILATTDPSPPGRLAARTYADIRDALFEEYPWNFAIKRVSIAPDASGPDWGFSLSYTLPSDHIRLIELQNTGDQDWRNEGNKIVTNIAAPLRIRYVSLVPVDSMTATFREALSSRLAMEWAEPLSQTTSVTTTMAALYKTKLQVARVADGQTDRQLTIDAPDFIDARY